VLAYLSDYHHIAGISPIIIRDDSADSFVSMSHKKLALMHKGGDKEDLVRDEDIVSDLAVICLAGYVGEEMYYKNIGEDTNTPAPDKSYSQNDYFAVEQMMINAGMEPNRLSEFEIQARANVEKNWDSISNLADEWINSGSDSLDPVDIVEFLDQIFGRNSWS
jgi:hypothetical protein